MLDVLLQTLPFFAVIALGYGAGKRGFFGPEATAALTRFVFYFALSAMLLKFSANLELSSVLSWPFIGAYLCGTAIVYAVMTAVALLRGAGVEEAALEAQCGTIGNVGFLGIPMLAMLLGPEAIGPIMLVLAVDIVVFGSLIVMIISARRDGRLSLRVLGSVGRGLLANPMIVSSAIGFGWSGAGLAIPDPVNATLTLLGAAATPGALFAIGASLATKSAERLAVAGWLSFSKLALHPGLVALMAFFVFPIPPFAAGVMVAAAALPVAGNVFILATHYNVTPARVSASILVSTALSILTIPAVIAFVTEGP